MPEKFFCSLFLLAAPVREPILHFVAEFLFRRFPNFFDCKSRNQKIFYRRYRLRPRISSNINYIGAAKIKYKNLSPKIQKFSTRTRDATVYAPPAGDFTPPDESDGGAKHPSGAH